MGKRRARILAQSRQDVDIRRQETYEEAKEFEERVAELFRFLGFFAVVDYQKDNLQFDIRLEMSGGPLPIYALVECKNTSKPVGQKQIREFASKVDHARRSDVLPYQAILISRSGFVNNSYEVARQQFVHLQTLEQLILSLVDFGPNLEAAVGAFRGTELERVYIEQDVVLQSSIRSSHSSLQTQKLTETVLAWLDQPKGTFLALLGDFGAGKTSFCKRLAAELAIRVREKAGNTRIPIVVDLRSGGSTTVTLENLLTHHFQCLSSKPLNPQSLLYLNREGYLVLLFDGFDEVIAYSEPNRYVENLRQILRAAEGRAKVILTCRTHYFRDQPEEIRHLVRTSKVLSTEGATRLYEEISQRPGVEIAYLRELSENQIDEYLRKTIWPPNDWQQLREQIWHTYNLRDLAERPFLLDIIVKTLPRLHTGPHMDRFTLADLYETYCESWFNHTDFRLTLTRERKEALVEHLARRIWNSPEQQVHYVDLFEECTTFFCDQPLSPQEQERIDFEVRTALFLHRNAEGHYSFIHRSFLEFFFARTLRAGLKAADPSCLDGRRPTREVAFFLSFWPEADLIPALTGRVLSCPYQPRISENALQLLCFHAHSLVGPLIGKGAEIRDSMESLHRIREQFKALRPLTIHLKEAELAGVDLRGANLDNAWLQGAKLDRAQLQGSSFIHARLERASLTFVDAWGARFEESHLSEADLKHANLKEACFSGADLTGADLSFARCSRGVLRTAMPEDIQALEAGSPAYSDTLASTDPQLARRLTLFFEDARAELKVSQIDRPSSLVPVPRDRPLPLSVPQQRIWFLSQLDPTISRTLLAPLHFRGSLSVTSLFKAANEIVRRHEILRTTARWLENEPVMEISPTVILQMPVIDLSGLPIADRQTVIRRLIYEEIYRPADLSLGPLFQIHLLALDEGEYVLLLSMDRLIADEFSKFILITELAALYGAFCRSVPAPFWDTEVQYLDFAQWQRQRLMTGLYEELAYWRKQLEGVLPFLELPTDKPRPAAWSSEGDRCCLKIAEATLIRLHSLASRTDSTLLMVLLASFKLLLSCYARNQDIVVGLPVHGRTYPILKGLIGPFSNTLVLRTILHEQLPFIQLLDRVREVTLGAHAYSDLPFEMLVEELKPERSLQYTPLFQVAFSFQDHNDATNFHQLAVTPIELDTVTTNYDLGLSAFEVNRSLSLEINYRIGLFDRSTIKRLLSHIENLITQAADSPELRLECFDLLSAAEHQQMIVEWNDTVCSFASNDLCLHELFSTQAQQTPNSDAVVFEGQALTYKQLNLMTDQWAHTLREFGIGPEVRVTLCMERSLEMIIGVLAVLKAGGSYIPLDPTYPSERLQFILQDSRASVLLTQRRLLETLPQSEARLLCADELWSPPNPEPRRMVLQRTCPDNLCYVIYTSGSTGRPKGVMNTHRGIVNRLLAMQAEYKVTPSDRIIQKTPYSFDISIWELFLPLLSGACLVLAKSDRQHDLRYLLELVSEQQITMLHFVPSMFQIFLQEPGLEIACTSLRQILVSGEALPHSLQERFFERLGVRGVALHVLYGPTEAAIDVTSCRLEKAVPLTPLGCPSANANVYLLDPQLRPVPMGVAGQLFIGGVQVARGYDQRPDLTANLFVPNPFSRDLGARLYASGDLARHSPWGSIEYLGRLDHQVKIRGFRIELGEIESALLQNPYVHNAVVIAWAGNGDRRLVAYIVNDSHLSSSDLRNFLKERLPEYMVPASYVFLDALPLTPSGKLDRRALPLPAANRPDLSNPYVAPRNFTERVLTEIWSDVLYIERVGIQDDFFSLGGHSLLALRLISQINKRLRTDLPLTQLFDSPTIEKIAEFLLRSYQSG